MYICIAYFGNWSGFVECSDNMWGAQMVCVRATILHILYVINVQAAIRRAGIQLYADDTVLYASDRNIDTTAASLQAALTQFTNWCHENKLSLNADKTKQMESS